MTRLAEHILLGGGCPRAGICTVAFSGGADSTALLLALHELRDTLGIDLRAVHVHHGIRGEEADRDAAFCAKICEKYGIPLQTAYVDVPAFAAQEKRSPETAARILRYRALEEAAPDGEIATAHHAADNAETVLFHLMRGSGTRGLRGILPRTGRIIRPILTAERGDILAYLAGIGESYVEDSTNALPDASRNRIRQQIIPAMQAECPALLRHIGQTAALIAEDEEFLSGLAEDAYHACRNPRTGGFFGLGDYPRPIRMRVYIRRLEHLPEWFGVPRIDPAFDKLRELDALVLTQENGTVNLSGDIFAQTCRGILYFSRRMPVPGTQFPLIPDTPHHIIPGKICIPHLYENGVNSRNHHKGDTYSTLDYGKIIGSPYFRQWRAADTVRLPARGFSSDLKTLVQQAFPPPLRRRIYVAYDEHGCIWAEGIGTAERVKPDETSTKLLVFSVTPEPD